jgi:hypothetical protein
MSNTSTAVTDSVEARTAKRPPDDDRRALLMMK